MKTKTNIKRIGDKTIYYVSPKKENVKFDKNSFIPDLTIKHKK